MNEVSLKPVIDELEILFSKFNKAFFEGKLEKPVITVSPDHTRGAYGWCTGWKARVPGRAGDQVPENMFALVAEPSSGPPRKFMFSVENVKWPLKNRSDNQ